MKIEKTLYLTATIWPAYDTQWSYSIYDYEPPTDGDVIRIVVATFPFEADVPDKDLPPLDLTLIAEYEKQKQQKMAKHEMEMRELDEKISSLLCLENKAA